MSRIHQIQKTTAAYYGLTVSQLLSKRRTRDIVRPRQMAMALATELTSLSLPAIGRAFGDMDHTTVMHACKQVAKRLAEHEDIAHDRMVLRAKLARLAPPPRKLTPREIGRLDPSYRYERMIKRWGWPRANAALRKVGLVAVGSYRRGDVEIITLEERDRRRLYTYEPAPL